MKKKIFLLLIFMIILTAAVIFVRTTNNFDEVIHNVLTNFFEPSEKFWVHRCNSIEKARAMSEKFSGIEIDANFYPEENIGRKFDISHDYSGGVQMPLENFMPVFAETNSKIWFDFKNLKHENAADSLQELENLLQKYNVNKARFIIESHNFRDLKIYHDAGFYTSFYVSVNHKIFKDNKLYENFCAEVRAAVSSGNVDAVSFPIEFYDAVKSAGVSADYLTWNTHNERWWTFYYKDNLREMVNDSQVKVILVVMKTPFDRY